MYIVNCFYPPLPPCANALGVKYQLNLGLAVRIDVMRSQGVKHQDDFQISRFSVRYADLYIYDISLLRAYL